VVKYKTCCWDYPLRTDFIHYLAVK
jgi:hypothetical protein